MAAALAGALVTAGCPGDVRSDCQTQSAIQGGYVLRFTRSADAGAGCEIQTPSEMGDVWVFDTLADSEIRAHSVSMPFPDPPPDTLPPNLIGAGKFTTREADTHDRCRVENLTTMSDDSSGSLLSYAVSNMEWLGGPTYQGAEFQTDVLVTVGSCTPLTGRRPSPRPYRAIPMPTATRSSSRSPRASPAVSTKGAPRPPGRRRSRTTSAAALATR